MKEFSFEIWLEYGFDLWLNSLMFIEVMRILIGVTHSAFGSEPRYSRKPTLKSWSFSVPVMHLAPSGAFDGMCFDCVCSTPVAFAGSLAPHILSSAIKIQVPDGVSHHNAAGTCVMSFQHAFARRAADDGRRRIAFS